MFHTGTQKVFRAMRFLFDRKCFFVRSFLTGMTLLLLCSHLEASHRIPKLLLVTGCSRSGTTYISQLLTEAGLPIGHEKMKVFGISDWEMAVDHDRAPWGPTAKKYCFKHIFHQVREPLACIQSIYSSELAPSWVFIQRHVPEINPYDSLLVMSAKYWYYWNLIAESRAEWTYRLENIDQELPEFSRRLGVPLDLSALDRIPRDVNHRKYKRIITWHDLEMELPSDLLYNIRDLSHRYGYDSKY